MGFVAPLDAAWLFVESRDTPMQVGCMQIFSPPAGARRDYVRRLVRSFKKDRAFTPPFSLRLRPSRVQRLLPAWEEAPSIDLDNHVKRWGLPSPGSERELGELISHLHAEELDMERPLWEIHFIEGLADNRYVMYTKMHHSLMDGVGGVRLLQALLSPDSQCRNIRAPWAPRPGPVEPAEPEHHHHYYRLNDLLTQIATQARTIPGVYGAFAALTKAALHGRSTALKAPYTAPKTIFNGRVSAERRFATQQFDLRRIRRLAAATRTTVNDVFLNICAGALQRYLIELDALPDEPLIAGLPVSVRPKDDMRYGTAVSFIMASLATDLDDPLQRLRAIHASTAAAKNNLRQMPASAFTEYTLLLMAPYILQLISGLGGRGRPVFNLVISNVPGPTETLYYNGARLEAMYPMSIVTQGQGLNITFMTYGDELNVGFTACNRCAPHVQRIAVYAADALDEMETVLNEEINASIEGDVEKPGKKAIER